MPGSIHLLPASAFTLDQLTAFYNASRSDYLIPMQMDPAHLQAYLTLYSVDLSQSWVAMQDGQALGLGCLGIRGDRAWVTRLGVLPAARGQGVAETIVRALLENARRIGLRVAILEVIVGNDPAHNLFLKLGFCPRRELLVLRRPAGALRAPQDGAVWLESQRALDLLRTLGPGDSPFPLSWTNEPETLANGGDVLGLRVQTQEGDGWLVFRRQREMLSHFVFNTTQGSPQAMAAALLGHLYHQYPQLDTFTENIAVEDPHLGALWRAGFNVAWRRTEMTLDLDKSPA